MLNNLNDLNNQCSSTPHNIQCKHYICMDQWQEGNILREYYMKKQKMQPTG